VSTTVDIPAPASECVARLGRSVRMVAHHVGMTPNELRDLERCKAREWRNIADRLEQEPKGDEALRLSLTGRTTAMRVADLRRAAEILDPAAGTLGAVSPGP
jgi:hypothetical protein